MNRNVTAVILIVLAGGVYVTLTQGIWNDTKAIGQVNANYQTAIANADTLIAKRDQVLKDYNALSLNDQDRLNKMLPTTVDNIRLIINLNGVAQKRGVVLKGVTVSAPTASNSQPAPAQSGSQSGFAVGSTTVQIPTATVNSVTVSFNTSTSYQTFIQFMRDLEASIQIMDLTHLSVKAHDNGINDYAVEMQTYWLQQQ